MFKKLTLAAAVGAGYVLGAKAGKERYNQIESKVREIAGMPAVQNATATVKDTAAPLIDTAKETVGDKVGSVTDKAAEKAGKSKDDSIDITAGGTGASTRPTTPAGVAPSGTAPLGTPPGGTAPIIRP